MELEVAGARVHYEVWGSAGPWLTLVHGAGDNLRCWERQVPAFSRRYRVLAWDLRGHGATVAREEDYSAAAQVRDLLALWQHLGIEQSALLGYSMGGRIALEAAAREPQRIAALVLANSGVGRPGGAPALSEEQRRQMEERRQRQLELLEQEGMAGLFAERVTQVFSPGFAERDPEAVERYRQVFVLTDAREYAKNLRAGMAFRQPLQLDLSVIRCPVLVIGGIYEAQWRDPATCEAVKATLPQAEIYIFPTGHFSCWEAPDQFNALVLDFLARAGA